MQNLLEGKGWLECNIRNDKTQEYVNYGLKLNALEFKADSFQYQVKKCFKPKAALEKDFRKQ